jgi:4-diphosphocytidyl-2-C-methyl-D-erythritol kinase
MIVYPNCKINLGLHILHKRADGYHDLETVFYPIHLTDILEIVPDNSANGSTVQYTQSGITIEGDPAANLCVKAYELLKKEYPRLPAARLHLHKLIPTGAGLGGGSADASFTLRLLNEYFKLDIPDQRLQELSLVLGSDCPFFIINKPCYATGRGEILEPVMVDLSGYTLVIVNPGFHISTAKAFAGVRPAIPAKSIKEIIAQPVSSWADELVNDFEKPLFYAFPEIAAIKEELYHKGASYASMSGSGSTVYGLFPAGKPLILNLPPDYFIKVLPA